uniref:Uncharacterized protein n=1 Tax=Rhizophora mucronata TaxID=61149 RepID=A0A2P2KXP4_RHIMU
MLTISGLFNGFLIVIMVLCLQLGREDYLRQVL